MSGAWIAVVLIAVGVPLLAWWWGGRGVWSRRDERGRQEVDVRQEIRRRHVLSPQETTRVEDAVRAGRSLDDARLRAAVVDWAERELGNLRKRGGLPSGIRGFLVVFWGLYAVLGVAAVVVSVAMGDGVPWLYVLFTVNGLVGIAGPLLGRRTLKRAIALNSDVPAAD
jgi:hypothetical protein